MHIKSIISLMSLLLLAVQDAAVAAPTKKTKRLLLPTAPAASNIDGAHLLIKNDVDTTYIIKNTFVLLFKPRTYWDGMNACLSMGDGGYIYIKGYSGGTEIVSLLNNSPAKAEVNAFFQF